MASAAVLIHLCVPDCPAQIALAHLCRHAIASHMASQDELDTNESYKGAVGCHAASMQHTDRHHCRKYTLSR